MAIGVRWRKVRGDLGQYRARTALVVGHEHLPDGGAHRRVC